MMEIKTSYTLPLEQDGDDLVLSFPMEVMEQLNWHDGDVLKWEDNGDGSWTLKLDEESRGKEED